MISKEGTGFIPNGGARGFTGHEHLDNVGLIHMNGRVYDPELGRFLSADPLIQAPLNTQSYNRYSYVFNNPLSYIDPTGFSGDTKETPEEKERRKEQEKKLRDLKETLIKQQKIGHPGAIKTYNSILGLTAAMNGGVAGQDEKGNLLVLTSDGQMNVVSTASQKEYGVGAKIGEILTAGGIVASFFTGIGPSHLEFGPDSIQSQSLSMTPEFDRVKTLFFKQYADRLHGLSDWSGIHATNFGKTISFAEGLKIAWDSPAGAYVGTFTVSDIVVGHLGH